VLWRRRLSREALDLFSAAVWAQDGSVWV
jgi:hypothetical protein